MIAEEYQITRQDTDQFGLRVNKRRFGHGKRVDLIVKWLPLRHLFSTKNLSQQVRLEP